LAPKNGSFGEGRLPSPREQATFLEN
jgi:hypothetical protein